MIEYTLVLTAGAISGFGFGALLAACTIELGAAWGRRKPGAVWPWRF